MTLRGGKKELKPGRAKKKRGRKGRLSGWKLVAAEAVVGLVATATLLITHSPEATAVVTAPLLLVIGVSAA